MLGYRLRVRGEWYKRILMGCWMVLALHGIALAQPDSLIDDGLLSLDSLLNLKISSVSKYEQTTSEAPASVSIISKEDILSFGYGDLMELLNAVRDLYITYDRNYGYLGIRGFGRPTDYNNRVAVMVNGVVLNENVWGGGPIGTELQGLNLDDVERVEVIRGPSSALYGTYPMLGMINVITHTGRTQNGIRMSVDQGSFGKWQGAVAAGKVWKNGLGLHVGGLVGKTAGQRLYYSEYDDSSTNNGIADHLDDSQYLGFNGHLAYKSLTLKTFYSWRDAGVPTGAYGTVFGVPSFRTQDSYGFIELGYAHDIGSKMAVQARTSFNQNRYRGQYPYLDADGGKLSDVSKTNWALFEARLRWDIAANNRLMIGAESQQNFQASYLSAYPGQVEFDGNFPYATYSVYVQDEYQPFKKLTITGGARYDRLYLGRSAITPRLALNYFVGKQSTIKLLYGQAFRAPSIYEVEMGFANYVLPNHLLKPERIKSFEIVYEQRFATHFYGVASLYNNRLNNLVEQMINPDSTLQFQNVGSAGGMGASAELHGRFEGGIHFYMNYSFTQMRNLQDDIWLTNSPQQMAKGGFSLPLLHHFRLSPEVVAQSARRTVYDSQTTPFVYASANFIFAPRFTGTASFLNHFQWSFKVRNLFNTDYRYPGGFEHVQPAIQQNGRNYNLKMTVMLF
jgi:outer membrane receptor for ferrienterochelin and colicins